jgi:hypothetical protein
MNTVKRNPNESKMVSLVNQVSNLSADLNDQLKDWDYYSAEKTMKEIQYRINSIKSYLGEAN